jgi:competence protein ComEA
MDLTRREKIGLLVFVLIIITVMSTMYYGNKSKPVEVIKKDSITSDSSNTKTSSIKVYVSGEVNNPGVYTLAVDDRIEKLIQLSGGFTDKADTSSINQAKKLKDEEFVLVPSKDRAVQVGQAGTIQGISNGKVNINIATLSDLKTLDGIGDTLAQRIIDYRTKNGPFSDIKDLKKVSGIGESRFKAIENKITVY